MSPASENAFQRLATNRQARHQYVVMERIEAGIALRGTEVKSARARQISLTGGFARIEEDQAVLCEVHIAPYPHGNRFNHEPRRPRRLLLHRPQIRRLGGQLTQKGWALIPLNVYLRKGRIKVELGLCRGKQAPDKRREIRQRVADREGRRALRRAS